MLHDLHVEIMFFFDPFLHPEPQVGQTRPSSKLLGRWLAVSPFD